MDIKLTAGWVGVVLVLISFLIQLWVMLAHKTNYKFLIGIQLILIVGAIFWILYAFLYEPFYWPTGVNNILVFIFNTIFVIINIQKWKKSIKKDYHQQ